MCKGQRDMKGWGRYASWEERAEMQRSSIPLYVCVSHLVDGDVVDSCFDVTQRTWRLCQTKPRERWQLHIATMGKLFSVYLNICYVVAGFGSIFADNAISIWKFIRIQFSSSRKALYWQMMHDCDYKPGFCSYEQTIAKLRDDLLYIQKFKTPLAQFMNWTT